MIVVCGSSQIFWLFFFTNDGQMQSFTRVGVGVGGGELKLGIVSALRIN